MRALGEGLCWGLYFSLFTGMCLLNKEAVVTAANFQALVWETIRTPVSAKTLENQNKLALMNHNPHKGQRSTVRPQNTFWWRVAVTLSRPMWACVEWALHLLPFCFLGPFLIPPWGFHSAGPGFASCAVFLITVHCHSELHQKCFPWRRKVSHVCTRSAPAFSAPGGPVIERVTSFICCQITLVELP